MVKREVSVPDHYLVPPCTDKDTTGTRLRKARIAKNLTITDLSAKAGIAASTISCFESDKTIATPITLKLLADVLEVTVAHLGQYEMMPEDTFGQKITKARYYQGQTKKEFAEMLGVNVRTIGDWEKDKRQPMPRHMQKLNIYIEGICSQ